MRESSSQLSPRTGFPANQLIIDPEFAATDLQKKILIGRQFESEKAAHGGNRSTSRDSNGQFTAKPQTEVLRNETTSQRINTAFSEFKRVGAELYKEALAILMAAWGGAPESLRAETLLGVLAFVELYHSDYNRTRLVNKLRNVDPISIYRSGRSDVNLPGTKKYLNQVYRIYNGASRKGTLSIRF